MNKSTNKLKKKNKGIQKNLKHNREYVPIRFRLESAYFHISVEQRTVMVGRVVTLSRRLHAEIADRGEYDIIISNFIIFRKQNPKTLLFVKITFAECAYCNIKCTYHHTSVPTTIKRTFETNL